jgi:hypothetical protein
VIGAPGAEPPLKLSIGDFPFAGSFLLKDVGELKLEGLE